MREIAYAPKVDMDKQRAVEIDEIIKLFLIFWLKCVSVNIVKYLLRKIPLGINWAGMVTTSPGGLILVNMFQYIGKM